MWCICVGTDLITWMMRSLDVDDTGEKTDTHTDTVTRSLSLD